MRLVKGRLQQRHQDRVNYTLVFGVFFACKNKKRGKQMNETKYYTIFSQRLMSKLVAQGFVLVNMRPDERGSGRNVFYFRNSPELRQAVEEYSSSVY